MANRAKREEATLTVHIPLAFRRWRGRKTLVGPDGAPVSPASSQPGENSAVVRTLARAFRWRRLIETGAMATVHDIAVAERINASYVSRVLRLTLLSPARIDVLMSAGVQTKGIPLASLMKPFPAEWQEQEAVDGESDRPRLRKSNCCE